MTTEVELFEYQDLASRPSIKGVIDAEGRAQVLANGVPLLQFGGSNGLSLGYDPLENTLSPTSGVASGQTGSTTVTASAVDTEYGPGVRFVTAGVTGEYAQIIWQLPNPMSIRQIAGLFLIDSARHSSIAMYVATAGGFGASTSISKTVSLTTVKNGALVNGLAAYITFGQDVSNAWANTGALNLDTTLFTQFRIRVTPVAGQLADFTLIGFRANPSKKSRIVISADDGYASWFVYALPLLQARGLRCSMGIIPGNIGSSALYMSLANLQAAVAQGHEVVTHGPIGGSGSLISNYTTTQQRIADMVESRSALDSLGLFTTSPQKKCYIWPQGEFQDYGSDARLLDAALQAGFTTARTVTRFLPFSNDLAHSTKYGGFLLPVVGHQRQTTSGAEDTEVANAVASIQYAAANGLDAILELHAVIADQGVYAATSSIDIEVSRLITILDAVTAQIAAGKMANVLLSNLAQ